MTSALELDQKVVPLPSISGKEEQIRTPKRRSSRTMKKSVQDALDAWEQSSTQEFHQPTVQAAFRQQQQDCHDDNQAGVKKNNPAADEDNDTSSSSSSSNSSLPDLSFVYKLTPSKLARQLVEKDISPPATPWMRRPSLEKRKSTLQSDLEKLKASLHELDLEDSFSKDGSSMVALSGDSGMEKSILEVPKLCHLHKDHNDEDCFCCKLRSQLFDDDNDEEDKDDYQQEKDGRKRSNSLPKRRQRRSHSSTKKLPLRSSTHKEPLSGNNRTTGNKMTKLTRSPHTSTRRASMRDLMRDSSARSLRASSRSSPTQNPATSVMLNQSMPVLDATGLAFSGSSRKSNRSSGAAAAAAAGDNRRSTSRGRSKHERDQGRSSSNSRRRSGSRSSKNSEHHRRLRRSFSSSSKRRSKSATRRATSRRIREDSPVDHQQSRKHSTTKPISQSPKLVLGVHPQDLMNGSFHRSNDPSSRRRGSLSRHKSIRSRRASIGGGTTTAAAATSSSRPQQGRRSYSNSKSGTSHGHRSTIAQDTLNALLTTNKDESCFEEEDEGELLRIESPTHAARNKRGSTDDWVLHHHHRHHNSRKAAYRRCQSSRSVFELKSDDDEHDYFDDIHGVVFSSADERPAVWLEEYRSFSVIDEGVVADVTHSSSPRQDNFTTRNKQPGKRGSKKSRSTMQQRLSTNGVNKSRKIPNTLVKKGDWGMKSASSLLHESCVF